MPIIEERLFGQSGLTWTLLARTRTPMITDLHIYRRALGTRVAKMERRSYDGKPGICFTLYDGRLLIVLLGKEDKAQADTHASSLETATVAGA